MQKHSLGLKKLISQAPEDATLKISRPVYKRLFKPNSVLRADQKSDVNQTWQQSVFSPIGACSRIWCTAGAVERRSQMFVYRLSPFPFPLLMIFSPFPQTESLFTGYVESWRKNEGLHKEIWNLTAARLAQYEPVCRAGGRWFKSRPDQHSGSLNNWGESVAFVMTSANG